jgi:hypothetical protein
VAADGSWNASFPAGPNAGPTEIGADCADPTTGQDIFYYASQDFTFTTTGDGYWMPSDDVASNLCPHCPIVVGPTLYPSYVAFFGDANFFGPDSSPQWGTSVVGLAADPRTGVGYWLVGRDGGVFTNGDSVFYGSLPGLGVAVHDIVGIAATPDGGGYWLVGSDGGVFAFGDARFYGSLPGLGAAVHDIVGIAATPDGGGYWLVGSDGGVFAFGGARFYGSLPGEHITPTGPIVGIAATPQGNGYWLAGTDGGVFSLGAAGFHGSLPGQHIDPTKPVVGIAATVDGNGYWLAGADGGVFSFGSAPFEGSCADACTTDTGAPASFIGISATPATQSS